jgi:hydroxymethylglutaryl-CoA lyase
MLHGLGIKTGVNLDAVAAAGRSICAAIGKEPASRVARAMAAKLAAENKAA